MVSPSNGWTCRPARAPPRQNTPRRDPWHDGGEGETQIDGPNHESPEERLNRNLDQLLQELRVALPGVQVLFAFLLVVPFNTRFADLTATQRDIYLVALLCSGLASALLIAPSVHHRVLFHRKRKPELVRFGSRLAIAGMVMLGAAFTSAVALIASFIFTTTVALVLTTGTALVFGVTWFGLPLWLKERPGVEDPKN